ncbi:MAG: UvrD-helicase domain-containing protein [Bacteroidota bacterium]
MSPTAQRKKAKLTDEQIHIVKQRLRPTDILSITAFAGTGKTTTLAAFAKNRPQQRFLYVAFNKSMQLEAQRKFPNNVRCRTAHALAFPQFGSTYKHKLGNPRVHQVRSTLNLSQLEDAKAVLDTVLAFCVSDDEALSNHHLPHEFRESDHGQRLLESANHLWQLMQDVDDESVPMPHDGYLKLFQLSKPTLNYDAILLDEAQDTNPVIATLLLNQQCARVLVGDPHQQIYTWRGAVDMMDRIEATRYAALTNSFRFNQTVADAANHLLREFKGEERSITGVATTGSFDEADIPYTMLARTNAGLFDEAVSHYRRHDIGFLGKYALPFDALQDAYYLREGKSKYVKDPMLKSMGNYEEMKTYAQTVEDVELLSLCKVMDNYEHVDIPSMLDRIYDKMVDEPQDADVILTTAHKAKGLEFKHVKLADDFQRLMDDGEIAPAPALEPEEVNVLYVAMTRASHSLELNEDVRSFLKRSALRSSE